MTASQFETRSNVTAVEWDMRKSESMIALGPALDRIDNEALSPTIKRVFRRCFPALASSHQHHQKLPG